MPVLPVLPVLKVRAPPPAVTCMTGKKFQVDEVEVIETSGVRVQRFPDGPYRIKVRVFILDDGNRHDELVTRLWHGRVEKENKAVRITDHEMVLRIEQDGIKQEQLAGRKTWPLRPPVISRCVIRAPGLASSEFLMIVSLKNTSGTTRSSL